MYLSNRFEFFSAFIGFRVEEAVKGTSEPVWQANSIARMVLPRKPVAVIIYFITVKNAEVFQYILNENFTFLSIYVLLKTA